MDFLLVYIVTLLLTPFVNWAIYQFAYWPRSIGPWTPVPENCSPRTWLDAVPFIGWIRLRRESSVHGRGYWIRPLLIQLCLPFFLAWLYGFEIHGGLLPAERRAMLAGGTFLYVQFVFHALLTLLLVVATFIDFDELTIPDWITLPGTLIAIIGSSIFSEFHLMCVTTAPPRGLEPCHPYSPNTFLVVWQSSTGLMIALACFSMWCFAVADRRVRLRRGLKKAVQYFFARLFRHWTWKILAAIWLGGMTYITLVFYYFPAANWQSLFSSLVGIAIGGGVVWALRVVASVAMRVEALGFGDVTLMFMVGAFLGWQACVLAFFIAPCVSIAIVLVRLIVTGRKDTPFGPYLCIASMIVLIGWDGIFNGWFSPRLAVLRPLIMWMLPGMLCVMGVLLLAIRLVKRHVFKLDV